MSIQIEPPVEALLEAKRLVIRCGTVEITSNGMGVGTLTVDGVELKHREISFLSRHDGPDQLVIRTTPKHLAAHAAALRELVPPTVAATPTVVDSSP